MYREGSTQGKKRGSVLRSCHSQNASKRAWLLEPLRPESCPLSQGNYSHSMWSSPPGRKLHPPVLQGKASLSRTHVSLRIISLMAPKTK